MAEGPAPEGVERPSDFSSSVARWDSELRSAEKTTERWRKDAARIADRFSLEKRTHNSGLYEGSTAGDFNVLASNIATMMPAVFGREPIPMVFRRHADRDPVGRIAAQILERALKTELEHDYFEDTMKSVTQDVLLCGRGVTWVRFEPHFAEVPVAPIPEMGGVTAEPTTEERLVGARTVMEYILWPNFLHSPKSSWAEVKKDGWVARMVLMTRDQGLERFGEIFEDVPLGEMAEGMEDREVSSEMKEAIGRAKVWEIRDALGKKAIWMCREYKDKLLDVQDDPLGLDEFFPCPMPAYGTKDNRKLVPIPDYLQYEKLADEMDDQTRRISVLTSALRAAGAYDSNLEGLGRLLNDNENDDNVMIPITNWEAVQNGDINQHISWMPLKEIAETLISLYDARDRTKDVMYEVSGMADIMRGSVDPREKLGQSRLKAQFGSQRLEAKVKVVEACARDTLAIKAEIMAEHYPDWLLRELSGFDFMPEVTLMKQDPQKAHLVEVLFQNAIKLLKDERMRGFRLDVETNSTILADDDEEKGRRIEALSAIGDFIERAMPLITQVPESAPMLLDALMFTIRSFRGGRQLEASIESFVDQVKQKLQQQAEQPEQPDPAQQAAEAEAQASQQKMQAETQLVQTKGQTEIAVTQAKAQADMQTTQAQSAERDDGSRAGATGDGRPSRGRSAAGPDGCVLERK